jgi:hypothetical protein
MPHTTSNLRYRMFLHLLKRLEAEPVAGIERTGVDRDLAKVLAQRQAEDWLGYETHLFRISTESLRALEDHHRRNEDRPHPTREYWVWETMDGTSSEEVAAHPTRVHAIMAAERVLSPGMPYRIGRVEVPRVVDYLPSIRSILAEVKAEVERRHPGRPKDWPAMTFEQVAALEKLFQGFMTAFLEEEAAPLVIGRAQAMEYRIVPICTSA